MSPAVLKIIKKQWQPEIYKDIIFLSCIKGKLFVYSKFMIKKRLDGSKLPKIRFNKTEFNKENLLRIIFVLLTLMTIAFLGYRFKDKFIAGTVNNQPIFRFQLTSRLYSQYGKSVMENLIVEKLIDQEAKTRSVSISAKEMEGALAKIKTQLGEETDYETFLASQGVKKADFERQLELELLVRKLLEKEISVSDEEAGKFITENRKSMTATNEADLVLEAKQNLQEQKFSDNLNSFIGDLVKKAKISRFLK